MNNLYKFKYKKRLFWSSVKAAGHQYDKDSDRMDIYHADGTITSLAHWSKYDLRLGKDWVEATKAQMEKEAGQPIKMNVNS